MLSVLEDEMERVNAKLADIGKMDQDAKISTGISKSCFDGLRKAEQTRGKDRVQRLGHVLGHAYQEGPRRPLDLAEN